METKAVKTTFNVKLMKFSDAQKVALIKEIKSVMPDTNLVQVCEEKNYEKWKIQLSKFI